MALSRKAGMLANIRLRPKHFICVGFMHTRNLNTPPMLYLGTRRSRRKLVRPQQIRRISASAVPLLPAYMLTKCEAQHTHNVLEDLDKLTVGHLDHMTPSQMVKLTEGIVAEQYTYLTYKIPWLRENIFRARLQLLAMNELNMRMQPVTSHSSFQCLKAHTMEGLQELSGDEVVSLLWAHLCLGMDKNNPQVAQLLALSHRNMSELSAQQLLNFQFICAMHPTAVHFYAKACVKRLLEMSTMDHLRNTHTDVKHTLFALGNLHRYLSARAVSDLIHRMHTVLQESDIEKMDPAALNQFLRFGGRTLCYGTSNTLELNTGKKCNDIFDLIGEALKYNTKHFGADDLSLVCYYLQGSSKMNQEILNVVHERVKELLSAGQVRLGDIIDMMFCISHCTQRELVDELCGFVKPHVSDLDIYSLSNMVQCLTYKIRDPELLKLIHRRCTHLASYIPKFSNSLFKLNKFLKMHPLKETAGTDFLQAMTSNATPAFFQDRRLMTPVLHFFTKSVSTTERVPGSLLDEVNAFSRYLRKPSVTQLVATMELMDKQNQTQQADSMQGELYAAVEKMLDNDVIPVRQLYGATKIIFGRLSHRMPQLLIKLVDHFDKYSEDWVDMDVFRISDLLSRTSCSKPTLYDKLLVHLTGIAEQSHPYSITLLLALRHFCEACARVNYKPAGFEEFVQTVILDHFDLILKQDLGQGLSIIAHLGYLGIFPEEQILKIFQEEFLQRVDAYIEESHRRRDIRNVENAMANINRSTVIERPQLDVPWFCGFFFEKKRQRQISDKLANTSTLYKNVEAVLKIVVGNQGYVTNVRSDSTYYHNIDMLVSMDERDLPIPADSPNFHKGAKRIAVLCLKNYNYCINIGSKELDGYEQLRIRHLEKLGYQVVTIPHFEWFSMKNALLAEQKRYLTKKIYS